MSVTIPTVGAGTDAQHEATIDTSEASQVGDTLLWNSDDHRKLAILLCMTGQGARD